MAKAARITSSKHYAAIKMAHTAAVEALDIIALDGRVLVALIDAEADVENDYVFECNLEAPMAAVTISGLEVAYWDNSAGNFTNVVGSNIKCGMFLRDQADTDTECKVYLTISANL